MSQAACLSRAYQDVRQRNTGQTNGRSIWGGVHASLCECKLGPRARSRRLRRRWATRGFCGAGRRDRRERCRRSGWHELSLV